MGQPFLMIDFPPGDHPQGAFFLMEVEMADCLQYMPFYTRDWIASTASFTPAQKGAYITLLAVAWTEGGVPNSYEACARIAGGITEDDWAVIRKRLVVLDAGTSDERLSHPRLEKERKAAAGRYESKCRAVAKARESRKAKTVDSSVSNSVVNIDDNTDNNIDNNTVVNIENNAQPKPEPKPEPANRQARAQLESIPPNRRNLYESSTMASAEGSNNILIINKTRNVTKPVPVPLGGGVIMASRKYSVNSRMDQAISNLA